MRAPSSRLCPTVILLLSLAAVAVLGVTRFAGSVPAADTDVGPDEFTYETQLLRDSGVGTDGPALLDFLRRHALTEADQAMLGIRLQDLGSDTFAVRERAARDLVAMGPAVRPALHRLLGHPDLEVVRRAKACLHSLARGPDSAVPTAVVRLLGGRRPPGAVACLLTYVPFAGEPEVEDEVLEALVRLTPTDTESVPRLTAALGDKTRRAAAAYVLGRTHEPTARATVHACLRDPDLSVRRRAAEGLLAGGDRVAVEPLIALLGHPDLPPDLLARTEEVLARLADDMAPRLFSRPGDSPEVREARWAMWWREHGNRTVVSETGTRRQLGLTLVAELDNNRVWEFGPSGLVRWELRNLRGPIDAQILPMNRVLVAEHNSQRVCEYNLKGDLVWQYPVTGNPIACQRLPNGNTFVATYRTLFEVTRDGKEVYNRRVDDDLYGARRLSGDRVVCVSVQGRLRVLDLTNGKELNALQLPARGSWCGVEALAGGRFLVALTNQDRVVELDSSGSILWECRQPGACHASRLANGNTLVACMNVNRVAELDRTGRVVRQTATLGRPFHAYRR